ncbi:hypothetical protein BT63DRAFT_255697 [Microthyrium microscopicum]|uniref:Uncharacterized protein n=1 Tax=Microthyrium microscopicum TaxID=703497 RepID=A0A6A6UCD0_9PEZI|nr:hypothetical protein BT63DRAFT_255697 [Microthyrium microscopicum]
MELDLCPNNSRRDTREIWQKLFAVHFTVVVAFCHLLHIRKEPITFQKLLFFLLFPPIFLIRHALATTAILGASIWNILTPRHWSKFDVHHSLWLLLGTISEDESDTDAISLSAPQKSAYTLALSWGRAVVICGFLTQCSGTIYLYNRRQQHEMVARADARSFELACAGILVGSLTLLNHLHIGFFGKPIPSLQSSTLPYPDWAADHMEARIEDWKLRVSATYFPGWQMNLLLHCFILCMRGSLTAISHRYTISASGLGTLFPSLWQSFRKSPLLITNAALLSLAWGFSFGSRYHDRWELQSVYLIVVFSALLLDWCIKKIYHDQPWWLRKIHDGLLSKLRFFFIRSVVLALFFILAIICLAVPLVGFGFREPQRMFLETLKLQDWPVDESCPLLWADPKSEWVWGLA